MKIDERAALQAEEERLRMEAQKWATRAAEARDNADIDEFEVEAESKRATAAYEAFLSGFSEPEDE